MYVTVLTVTRFILYYMVSKENNLLNENIIYFYNNGRRRKQVPPMRTCVSQYLLITKKINILTSEDTQMTPSYKCI